MVAGFWMNQDGLPLQFGTQKAIPELGGDYLVYGETREIEQIISLVGLQDGNGNVAVPALPTSFSGTSTPIAAGIQSMTTLVPLQITAPNTTVSNSQLTLVNPQLFFEQVEIVTLVPAAGGTSLSIGLATQNPSTGQFVQVTPNAGVQLINSVVTASMATTGQKTTWNLPGATGIQSGTAALNTVAGGGTWLGNVPLVTNAITPLPTSAWISAIATGTFTNGLIKFRLKYTMYGNIAQ